MLNTANAITLLRFALVPAIALRLVQSDYTTALLLFMVAALSDFADGVIARHWNLRTRFGAVADPLTTLASIALSGAHYVLLWGGKAGRARHSGLWRARN
ncbi:MAG: CDP-alcohol phosphatidyltransferase family protein [Burkholderiaceae bacterium]